MGYPTDEDFRDSRRPLTRAQRVEATKNDILDMMNNLRRVATRAEFDAFRRQLAKRGK